MAPIHTDLRRADSRCYGELLKWGNCVQGNPLRSQEQLLYLSCPPHSLYKQSGFHLLRHLMKQDGKNAQEGTEVGKVDCARTRGG